MTQAFLLTSHWQDTATDTQLTFWWLTPAGPVRQQLLHPAVCFIRQQDQQRASSIAATLGWPVQIRPVPLQHFDGQAAAACYLPAGYIYRWRDVLQEQGIPCRETDIRPTDRYLMERFVYGAAVLHGDLQPDPQRNFYHCQAGKIRSPSGPDWRPPLRCLSLDIETSFPRRGQPDRLFSVGLYADDCQRVLMLGEPDASTPALQFFADEPALLQALLQQLADYDPDVIMGWNIVQFDFEFLRRKFQQHAIPFTLGRDGSELEWRQSRSNPERIFLAITGRVVLDGIDLLRNATYQFESFALNDVAQHFLGEQKLLTGADRGGDIEHLFIHDKPSLAAYNLKDCQLVWQIFARAGLLEFAIERARMTGLTLDRNGGSVAAFENLYLPRLHRAGFVAPDIGDGYSAEKSPGGYVMNSRPGLFEHVLVLDFKSLYPSIIRTFCIDPMGLVEGMRLPAATDHSVVPGFFGGRFHPQRHILPALIRQLGDKREQAKQAGNKALSQAIKVIMASCYGVLGSEGCRFYDTRLSASITKRGHEIIQRSSQWLQQQGYDVIYGDTDSVFVWLKTSVSDEQADRIGRQLVQGLNAWWAATLQREFGIISYLEMEYETHYRRFFMPSIRGAEEGSKKRYAGLIVDARGEPQMVFKGLETVRSDWTPLARNFQKELYRRIFLNQPYAKWLRDEVKALLAGERDQQLVYRKRLRQPLSAYQKNIPPHAQAAAKLEQWLQLKGLPSRFGQRGGRIEYRMTLNGPEPLWPDGSVGAAVDYGHYLEKQLRPLAEAIFHFIGEDFADLAGLQLSLF
ncbi:DNA polymerase II [Oceanospirillaceae bacterium ASx5O]|nr:DNA polymerase II [Oceanospirillaceae bacterium ASx5O]